METHFKYCDHQYVSSGCVRRSAFPSPGVCSEANTGKVSPQWQVAAMFCMVGRHHSTGVAMMKFPAGLNDECADALLILFAATMEILIFQDWWRFTIFPHFATC